MITDFILSAIFSGINALLSLAPAMTLPTMNDQSSFFGIVKEADGIIPIFEIAIGLTAVLAVRIGLQGWDLIVFVYHQFWGGD